MNHKQLINLIQQYPIITIFGHVYPDGDCFGGQVGLKEFILSNFQSKQVFLLGSGLPSFASIFGTTDQVSDEIIKNSLALVIDLNDTLRSEDARFNLAKDIFMVDHHIIRPENTVPGWYNESAAAVCEMIGSLLLNPQYTISKRGALALGFGIVSDTGRFLYDSVTNQTFLVFNKLMSYGIRMQEIYPLVYETSEEEWKINAFVYAHYQKTPDGVVYIYFNKNDLLTLKIDAFKAVSKINLLANLKGFPIWAAFAEAPDFIKGEIRSNYYAVQPIAHHFGGGGHKLAAGMPLKSGDEVKIALKMLGELIK